MQAENQVRPSLASRAAHELKRYLATSFYLFVCFGALIFYKKAVLNAHGFEYTIYGLAAIKALIMAKFMLVGHALHLGEEIRHKALIYQLLYRSFVFLVMLFVLSAVEDLVRGQLHGLSAADSFAGFLGGTWEQILAVCILMWLILLPYFAFRLGDEALGAGTLRRMFFAGGR